jgi:hypothetical protein
MSFSQTSHPGNMPIRVLQNNVIHHFENVRDGALERHKQWVASGKIRPGLKWLIQKERVATPYADCDTKEIVIQEVFLAYIWAIAYSMFVIYEEAIQKKMINDQWKGNVELDTALLRDAEKLLNWALTLTNRYIDWDMSLPNPETHKSIEEKFYTEKVNGIFLDMIVFILFHECCHLVNDHCKHFFGVCSKVLKQLSQSQIQNYKALENEADIFAIESLISSTDTNQWKLVKGLSIVLANISLLFIVKNPKRIKSATHPDIDTRLHNFLEYLDQDLPNFDYLWYLACFASRIFFRFHRIPVKNDPANTSIDLFYRYLSIFDNIKN